MLILDGFQLDSANWILDVNPMPGVPRDALMLGTGPPVRSAPCFREGPSRREYHKVICSLLDCYCKSGLERFKSAGDFTARMRHDALPVEKSCAQ